MNAFEWIARTQEVASPPASENRRLANITDKTAEIGPRPKPVLDLHRRNFLIQRVYRIGTQVALVVAA